MTPDPRVVVFPLATSWAWRCIHCAELGTGLDTAQRAYAAGLRHLNDCADG